MKIFILHLISKISPTKMQLNIESENTTGYNKYPAPNEQKQRMTLQPSGCFDQANVVISKFEWRWFSNGCLRVQLIWSRWNDFIDLDRVKFWLNGFPQCAQNSTHLRVTLSCHGKILLQYPTRSSLFGNVRAKAIHFPIQSTSNILLSPHTRFIFSISIIVCAHHQVKPPLPVFHQQTNTYLLHEL